MEEERNNYGQRCLEMVKQKGINIEGLTADQATTIMIPCDAPENFYCDGEISHKQALIRWKEQLKNSGLKPEQITTIVKLMIG